MCEVLWIVLCNVVVELYRNDGVVVLCSVVVGHLPYGCHGMWSGNSTC